MDIIEKYKQAKETEKLTPCIYEERDSGDDREWFQDEENNWCYIETKYIKDEYSEDKKAKVEVYNIVRKRIKTFNKKCSVQSLSFEYFMVLKYIEIYDDKQPYVSDVQRYFIERYIIRKKENPSIKIEDFLKDMKQEKIQDELNAKKLEINTYKGCGIGCLVVIAIIILAVIF